MRQIAASAACAWTLLVALTGEAATIAGIDREPGASALRQAQGTLSPPKGAILRVY